ncbi:MAG: DUF917 family protein [Thermomicrobiales bacterium]
MPWHLTKEDVQRIATGAGILGTGGGHPYRGMVRAIQELEQGRVLTVVRLDELADALIVPLGGMGAPTIGQGKIGRGDEGGGSPGTVRLSRRRGGRDGADRDRRRQFVRADDRFRPARAGDGRCRRHGAGFPGDVDDLLLLRRHCSVAPIVMIDERHQKVILEHIPDTATLERISRAICVQLGGRAMIADKADDRSAIARGPAPTRSGWPTPSAARLRSPNRLEAIRSLRSAGNGRHGSLQRQAHRRRPAVRARLQLRADHPGWARRLPEPRRSSCRTNFLICRVDGETTAIVPDLITLVDTDRGTPITTEVLRYGLRATVIGIPAPPQLTTAQALGFVGPQAFGYDEPFVPLEVNSRTR